MFRRFRDQGSFYFASRRRLTLGNVPQRRRTGTQVVFGLVYFATARINMGRRTFFIMVFRWGSTLVELDVFVRNDSRRHNEIYRFNFAHLERPAFGGNW